MIALAKNVLGTPIIWGLSCGLASALLGIEIPGPLDAVAKGLGSAATPCALFALGASLTRYSLGGNLREPALLVGWKTRCCIRSSCGCSPPRCSTSPLWVATGVLLAALPAGITPYLFAQRYGACQSTVASAVVCPRWCRWARLSALLFVLRP